MMKRNINIKIVVIYFFIGIIIILGLGVSYFFMLNQMENVGIVQDNEQLINSINNQLNQNKIIIIVSIIFYTIISILIGIFVIKALVSPMKKLIKSAEKVAAGEKIELDKKMQNMRRGKRFRECI